MDVRDLQRALRRKLDAVEEKEGHHIFYWATIDGREFRAAKFSHSHRGQLNFHILADTAKRLRLTRAQLDELVDCSFSEADSQRVWRAGSC